MGLSRVATNALAVAIICTSAQVVHAGVVEFDNGLAMADGWTNIQVDDYGSYGRQYGTMEDDEYHPPGSTQQFTPTYLTGVMMWIKTPGKTSRLVLTDDAGWTKVVEPPNGDGITGDHTGLQRIIVTQNTTGSSTQTSSAFALADTGNGVRLDFALSQQLTSHADLSASLDQIYRVTNNGSEDVELVMTFLWEVDLYYSDNSWENDIVGAGAGLCYVYQHDPGSSVFGVSLGAGPMSTVPVSYYFGGKEFISPMAGGPAFEDLGGPIQPIWNDPANDGMPVSWRNFVAGRGYNMTGEDPSLVADTNIGIEFRFAVPRTTSQTVHARRNYGSLVMQCAGCGNGVVDGNEPCDGADTPSCNGATCTASDCGDLYLNTMADEECDIGTTDSAECNAMDCKLSVCGDGYHNAADPREQCDDGGDSMDCNFDCTPRVCGDGYVNTMAREECEEGDICDLSTCTYAFSIGGGCAGCGAGNDSRSAFVMVAVALPFTVRRRRRARAA